MAIYPDMGASDVVDGESPIYTHDSTMPPNSGVSALGQASGSFLDSDTVQGITAVTATVSGPNKLVATDATGALPLGILPTGGAIPGIIPFVAGTYSALKGASRPHAISLCLATDQGVAGALYLYMNNTSAGDSGFVFIGGS